ncbi:MAG: FAD-dependent oxidoreductase, partial [Actinomycetes bacterium]
VGGFIGDLNQNIPIKLLNCLKQKNVIHLQRTPAIGLYDQNYVIAVERRTDHLNSKIDKNTARIRTWHIRAKEIVLATGAMQRVLVFPNNDRPGILLSHAAATYLDKYRVGTFKNAVVFTVDDYGYEDALRINKTGTKVKAIVDVRQKISKTLEQKIKKANIELILGSRIIDTKADFNGCLNTLVVKTENEIREIDADLLAISGGWTPTVHLATFLNLKPIWEENIQAFKMPKLPKGLTATGWANGEFEKVENKTALYFGELNLNQDEISFVDLQRDATLRDLKRAVGAGLSSIEHIKRYTTIGTAHDQGKTSGTTTMGLLSELNFRETT